MCALVFSRDLRAGGTCHKVSDNKARSLTGNMIGQFLSIEMMLPLALCNCAAGPPITEPQTPGGNIQIWFVNTFTECRQFISTEFVFILFR